VVAKPFLVALAASSGLSVFLGAAIAAPPGAAPSARAATTSRVVVVGARSVPADVLERAARQAASNISDPAAATRAAAAAVVREYRRRGFPVAQVVESAPQPDGSLRLTVAEGVVRRILLRGNRKTRSGTIVAALATRPGDVYREDRAQDDRNRLARLGIFEDVTIAPASPGELEREEAQARQAAGPDASSPATPPAAPPSVAVAASADEDTVGLVDVIVRVRERRTGNIAAALGFGGRSGLIGYADASETNFAGRAQRVSLQFQRFSRTYFDERDGVLREEDARAAYSLSYFAPFLGARSTAIGVDVYDKNTIFQPLFGAEDETLRTYERRRGATLRVGRQPGPRGVSAFVTVRRDQVGYDPIPLRLDPPLGELADADATVGALGLEVAWDTRDALLNPATGFYASLAYETRPATLAATVRLIAPCWICGPICPCSAGPPGRVAPRAGCAPVKPAALRAPPRTPAIRPRRPARLRRPKTAPGAAATLGRCWPRACWAARPAATCPCPNSSSSAATICFAATICTRSGAPAWCSPRLKGASRLRPGFRVRCS
jgi:hypothetical protein